MTGGRAASVHARLLVRAKDRGEDFNLVLGRYAIERFLYRLSVSQSRNRFCLKGALLFDLWFGVPHRPTRDADFLGFGAADASVVAEAMRNICGVDVDDGVTFDPESISVEDIRENNDYGGLRVKIRGHLGNARCSVQVDIGFGDAVTPGPQEIVYPTLLKDQPAPRLLAYPRETVVAEKFEAIVGLGMANSRMKDYFDLRALVKEGALDTDLLADAIAATFSRRKTPLPKRLPLGLSSEFARDTAKTAQWRTFLAKNGLEAPQLVEVVADIGQFLEDPLRVARGLTPGL